MSPLGLLLHLLFPVKCLVCGKAGEPLCRNCANEITDVERFPLCLMCGLPSPCKAHGDRYTAVSAAPHSGWAREAVLALKYGKLSAIGSIMGETMGRCIEKPRGDGWCVSCVPLHRSSTREYNQARCIASGLARQWDLPMTGGLKWSVDRDPQSISNSITRRNMPTDAIVWTGGGIAEKKIVLVDDVRTTGTTLIRCSRALYNAGAEKVFCITWSRASDHI